MIFQPFKWSFSLCFKSLFLECNPTLIFHYSKTFPIVHKKPIWKKFGPPNVNPNIHGILEPKVDFNLGVMGMPPFDSHTLPLHMGMHWQFLLFVPHLTSWIFHESWGKHYVFLHCRKTHFVIHLESWLHTQVRLITCVLALIFYWNCACCNILFYYFIVFRFCNSWEVGIFKI